MGYSPTTTSHCAQHGTCVRTCKPHHSVFTQWALDHLLLRCNLHSTQEGKYVAHRGNSLLLLLPSSFLNIILFLFLSQESLFSTALAYILVFPQLEVTICTQHHVPSEAGFLSLSGAERWGWPHREEGSIKYPAGRGIPKVGMVGRRMWEGKLLKS